MIPNAKLYKGIYSNDYQELRWDIDPILIRVERISNIRKSNLTVVDNLSAKKFSTIYRVVSDYKPIDVSINDKIEFEGHKGLVTYTETPASRIGNLYQTIVGIE